MSSDVAISVRGLGKSFQIAHQEQHITLTEQVLHKMRHPLRRRETEKFWALRDIDLDVQRGEVLGIIGRNGAGKSTLLKVLSRITPPTTGRIDVYGRIGSLLEVGTGFHPELTGRENVYLNGSILGMRRAEIDRQFDAIVDFAGVERFLDTPVKRYSSGMYVRLAFAVAAHLETEILIIDEVLAVGDAEFQEKCIGQMRSATEGGRTVLLVSHNLTVIEAISDRCAFLQNGSLAVLSPGEAVRQYGAQRTVEGVARRTRPVGLPITILDIVRVTPEAGRLGRDLEVLVTCELADRDARFVSFGLIVNSDAALPVASGLAVFPLLAGRPGISTFRLRIPVGHLAAGRYSCEVNVGAWTKANQYERHDVIVDGFSFEQQALPTDPLFDQRRQAAWHGHVRLSDVSVELVEDAATRAS